MQLLSDLLYALVLGLSIGASFKMLSRSHSKAEADLAEKWQRRNDLHADEVEHLKRIANYLEQR